ncbi:MAG TPA: lyase family protein, partial [Burkholderiales bacterium]|nr:lyase family protein [Burkholderiales bacterium]
MKPLTALSPLDGRYYKKVEALRGYFSEFALIRYRVQVEIEWLKALSREPAITEVPQFSSATLKQLDAMAADFSEADAEAVKTVESRINHDIKAIEYWLKERVSGNPE